MTDSVISNYKSIGGELELGVGAFDYVTFFDEVGFGDGSTDYFVVDFGWEIIDEKCGATD